MPLDKNELVKLFKKAQSTAKAAAASEGTQKRSDERILKFQIGNTYHLRLLFMPGQTRQSPFIEQHVHAYYDKATQTYSRAVCPTSNHISGSAGFNQCPICKSLGEIWRRAQNGDPIADEMYRNFRRQTENYAVVYVVKDSSVENPQTGKVKIIKYGYGISKFLNAECLGIAGKDQPEIDINDIVGFEAFDLDFGRDLIIKVGKKEVRSNSNSGLITFPSYDVSFSRKLTSIPLHLDELPKVFKELRFDEDFLGKYDEAALNNFYSKYISKAEAQQAVESESAEEDVPYSFSAPKTAPVTSDKEDESKDESKDEEQSKSEDDIDDLLADFDID